MTANQSLLIKVFLCLSVAVFLFPLVAGILKAIFRKSSIDRKKRSGVSVVLKFSLFLLLSVWCMRYCVGYYINISEVKPENVLGLFEQFVNSVLHALRTFSIDEEYKEYILKFGEMLSSLKDFSFRGFFLVYASVLNLIAPIAGGAIIFEILAKVFPKIKLKLSYFLPWKEKYFFSELNSSSLALAKSLYASCRSRFFMPVMIFTDTHVDDEKETDYELLLEAKRLGAVCVRDDLSHVQKNFFGKRAYFLIDYLEYGNLRSFIELADKKQARYIKGAKIYLFVESDAYVQVEQRFRKKLENELKFGTDISKNEMPTVIPINSYRNLVYNLLVDVPLYEPVVNIKTKEINITILGNGIIGTEAFLAVYWMGQILGYRINVNVVSKDTEEIFWSKIDYINPEIRPTVQKGNDILKYNDNDRNEPYCTVKYFNQDVKIGGFWDQQNEDVGYLFNTDYFIVALGSDENNISVSEKIRLVMGKSHIKQKGKHTVIAYAVYDSEICRALNNTKHYFSYDNDKPDIYMHAFGSLDEVYSCDNILMTRRSIWEKETGEKEISKSYTKEHIKANNTRSKGNNDDYLYWANLARALHLKYKVFSLGEIKTSVFSFKNEEECEKGHYKEVKAACLAYKKVIVAKGGVKPDKELKSRMEDSREAMAWLEHRRWNAFTRAKGFVSSGPTSMDNKNVLFAEYFEATKSHKNMSLKLHSCLVECDPGFGKSTDLLDRMSVKLYELKKAKDPDAGLDDYKAYDYYEHDFENYCSEAEVAKILGFDRNTDRVRRLCRSAELEYALKFEDEEEWLVPCDSVKAFLKKDHYTLDGLKESLGIRGKTEDSKLTGVKGSFKFCNEWFIPRKGARRLIIMYKRNKGKKAASAAPNFAPISVNNRFFHRTR